jgi:hypothetical protein
LSQLADLHNRPQVVEGDPLDSEVDDRTLSIKSDSFDVDDGRRTDLPPWLCQGIGVIRRQCAQDAVAGMSPQNGGCLLVSRRAGVSHMQIPEALDEPWQRIMPAVPC